MEFARHLRRLMDEQEATQAELARHLGVYRSTVHFWLEGRSVPGFARLKRIAKFFRVTVSELLGEKQPKRRAA
jgi:transcriptional regulator with XRE-family HTH domain